MGNVLSRRGSVAVSDDRPLGGAATEAAEKGVWPDPLQDDEPYGRLCLQRNDPMSIASWRHDLSADPRDGAGPGGRLGAGLAGTTGTPCGSRVTGSSSSTATSASASTTTRPSRRRCASSMAISPRRRAPPRDEEGSFCLSIQGLVPGEGRSTCAEPAGTDGARPGLRRHPPPGPREDGGRNIGFETKEASTLLPPSRGEGRGEGGADESVASSAPVTLPSPQQGEGLSSRMSDPEMDQGQGGEGRWVDRVGLRIAARSAGESSQ